jgi:hypothetical protein
LVVALLCANDYPLWVGPISKALGGADISIYASTLVAWATLWILERRRHDSVDHGARPAEDLA